MEVVQRSPIYTGLRANSDFVNEYLATWKTSQFITIPINTLKNYRIPPWERLNGWNICPITDTIKRSFTINSKTTLGPSLNQHGILLVAMEKDMGNGQICRKGAFFLRENNGIILSTSFNYQPEKPNVSNSFEDGWFVGRCGVSAPLEFWYLLKTLLILNY